MAQTLRDRVVLALRRLGIGTAQGEGFNKLDKLMGKAQGFTSGMCGRTSDPRLSNVILLARTLHVRLEWLATGEGPMPREGEGGDAETNAALPGWAENAPLVKGVPRYAVEAVGRAPVLLRPEAVTVDYIRGLAAFWLSWSPGAAAAAAREVEELRCREDARADKKKRS